MTRGISIDELQPADRARALAQADVPSHNGVALGENSPLLQVGGGKPRKAKRQQRDLEHPEQAELFRWAAELEPKVPALAFLFAIPNYAGNVSPAVRGRARAEGKKAGVPDICLPVPRPPYAALYIEMKSEEGTPSQSQKTWIHALRGFGNRVEVVNNSRVAKLVICEYLGLSINTVAESPRP